MPKFDIWLEFYGRKLLVRGLEATDENEALKTIRWKIRFDKIKEVEEIEDIKSEYEKSVADIFSVFDGLRIKL